MTRAQLIGATDDPLLTSSQAGQQLGVSTRSIQLWVESCKLPCYRTVGGHRRIHQSDVNALKDSLKRNEVAELLQKTPAPLFGGLNPKLAAVAADVLRTGLLSREGVEMLLQELPRETRCIALAGMGWDESDLLEAAEDGMLTLAAVLQAIGRALRGGV